MSRKRGIRIESAGKPHDTQITLIDSGFRIDQFVTSIRLELDAKSQSVFRVLLEFHPNAVQIDIDGQGDIPAEILSLELAAEGEAA